MILDKRLASSDLPAGRLSRDFSDDKRTELTAVIDEISDLLPRMHEGHEKRN